MRALLLTLAVWPSLAGAVSSGPSGLPEAALREIARLEEGLRATWTGRRLLAETLDVPRRGVMKLEGPSIVAYQRGEPPSLVLDLRRLSAVTEWEFELALARELARASLELPMALPEEEMAAWQTAIEFAVEKASSTPAFSKRLKQAVRSQETLIGAHRAFGTAAKPPAGEIELLSYHLALFRRSPDELYWVLEQEAARKPGVPSLAAIEDILRFHGPEISRLALEKDARYARLGGRRYPAGLVRAARAALDAGGAGRLRESLGSFDGEGAAALKAKLDRWASRP